jgi:2-oxoglutarate ferredoxin oxidoreductase subunit beta
MEAQLSEALDRKGAGNLDKLLAGNETWEIK